MLREIRSGLVIGTVEHRLGRMRQTGGNVRHSLGISTTDSPRIASPGWCSPPKVTPLLRDPELPWCWGCVVSLSEPLLSRYIHSTNHWPLGTFGFSPSFSSMSWDSVNTFWDAQGISAHLFCPASCFMSPRNTWVF